MLDNTMKKQLASYLANLKTPVELVAYLGDGEKSRQMDSLIQDIDALSDNIRVSRDDDAAVRRPAMGVRSTVKESELRFAGLPMGHEFTSLVLAILHSGGHPMKLDEALIEQVRQLEGEVALQRDRG